MITGDQIVLHLVGDYLTQSHWMAQNKTKNWWPALVHAMTYSLPFVLITQSAAALGIIFATHYLIDRYRLARFVVWLKNGPLVLERQWDGWWPTAVKPVTATGYPEDTPPWLAVWLLIFADNTLHLICNGVAIAVFP